MKAPQVLETQKITLAAAGAALLLASSVAALEPSGGETSWRWIGIRQAGFQDCPAPSETTGWSVEPLFQSTENKELSRFCLYSRENEGSADPLLSLPLERIDPDIMGLAPQGSALADASWEALQAHFLARVGQVPPDGWQPPTVRLAVIDASPTGVSIGPWGPEDVAANSLHGTALLNMARDLLCDSSELFCRAQVTSRLALAFECFDPLAPYSCRNVVDGGYFGLIGELAQVIHQEVLAWQGSSQETRLVLNLSLGWQIAFGGGEVGLPAMPAPVQANYRALEDAVCRGVLPIVAAGNRSAAVAVQQGPFLPALWEYRRAPSRKTCLALGVSPAAGLDGPTAYRPLVYAVAGVKDFGEPLDMTRAGGVARLAAFADHAVVEFSDTSTPTGTLTGSSVASLVVSSTAAAAWSYLPGTDAFELMEMLYTEGTSLGREADFCLAHRPCPTGWSQVREVSFCSSLAEACRRGGLCTAPTCTVPPALDLSAVDLTAFETALSIDVSTIDSEMAPQPECGSEVIYYDASGLPPQDPCPHRQFNGAQIKPWAEAQPQEIPCPNCIGTFSSPGKLFFEVDDLWDHELSSATLKCGMTSYALGLGTLTSGDQVFLEEVPVECLSSFPTFLSFSYDDSRAVIVPLRLCEDCR